MSVIMWTKTAFQRLSDRNTCSPVGAVCKHFGSYSIAGRSTSFEVDLRVYRLTIFPVCFLCFQYVAEDVVSQFPALFFYCHASHITGDSPETINPTGKLFLPQVAFVIVFYHSRKTTSTEYALTENLQKTMRKKKSAELWSHLMSWNFGESL